MLSQGKWAPSGSSEESFFGRRWDEAVEQGEPFGLEPAQVLAAGRLGMGARTYAALLQVRNLDHFREYEEQVEEETEAAREARQQIRVEQIRAGMEGAL